MNKKDDVIEIDFLQILEIIKKNLIIFISICLLCATAGFVYSKFFVEEKYSTTAKLIVVKDETASSSAVTYSDLTLSQRLVSTYKQIIMSEVISDTVIANINESLGTNFSTGSYNSMVSVSSSDNSEILNINVTSNDPIVSAAVANEVVDVFMDKIFAIYEIQNVTILNRAKVPTAKSSPNNLTNAIKGGIVGVLICAVIAFIILLTDTKVKSEEDVKKIFDSPIIGMIPVFEIEEVKDDEPNV